MFYSSTSISICGGFPMMPMCYPPPPPPSIMPCAAPVWGFGCCAPIPVMPCSESFAAGYCTGLVLSSPVVWNAIGKGISYIGKGLSWVWNNTLGRLFKHS